MKSKWLLWDIFILGETRIHAAFILLLDATMFVAPDSPVSLIKISIPGPNIGLLNQNLQGRILRKSILFKDPGDLYQKALANFALWT